MGAACAATTGIKMAIAPTTHTRDLARRNCLVIGSTEEPACNFMTVSLRKAKWMNFGLPTSQFFTRSGHCVPL